MPYKLKLILITMMCISCSGHKKVQKLFNEANLNQQKVFDYELLEGLPLPVQRYFKYALPKNQKYLSSLRLKHTGNFKTGIDKKWVDIQGQQYFTADPPGFVWVGKTKAFNAHDSYVNNQGNLSVYLFGFLKIVNSKGPTVDQAELLRWLGESVWMPTNLLPDEHIKWEPVNDHTARLIFIWNDNKVHYDVYFNETGQIIRLETERYMNQNSLKPWVGHFDNYMNVDGIKVPAKVDATWILNKGRHHYASFIITDFEFNKPEKF